MRRTALGILILMVLSPSIYSLDDLGEQTRENIRGRDDVRLAIVPPEIEGRRIEKDFLSWLEERITMALTSKESGLSVVVRKELDLIRKEKDMQKGSFYDPAYRADFGDAAGVNAFGFFDIIDWGDRYLVYLDVISASTGEIVSSARTVLRKTNLPSKFMKLGNIKLDDLGSPEEFRGGVQALVGGEGIDALAGRRVALAQVNAQKSSKTLQRALVREFYSSLYAEGPEGMQLLSRDFGRDLLSAIKEEMASAEDPEEISELAPSFLGADVLVSLDMEVDYVEEKINLSIQLIDAEKSTYLPGSARVSVPLSAVYRPIYLEGDYLEIDSRPTNVAITIDGRSFGKTPVIAYGLEEGEYTVELEGVAPYGRTRKVFEVKEKTGGRKKVFELSRPNVVVTVLDDETGEKLSEYSVDSSASFTRSEGKIRFERLDAGEEAQLEFSIEKEGYARLTKSLPLPPSLDTRTDREVRLVPRKEKEVTFLSTPENALLFIDNAYVGRTPVKGHPVELAQNSIDIRMQLPRWNSLKQTLDVKEIEEGQVYSYTLSRELWIRSTPPGAEIVVNGEKAGRTDAKVALPAGPNTIDFKMGEFSRSLTFDPAENDAGEVSVTVTGTKKRVPIELHSNIAGTEVWVDNEQAEKKNGRYLVPEGYQRLRFAHAGYAPEIRYLDVKRGAAVHVSMLTVEEKQLVGKIDTHVRRGNYDRAEELTAELREKRPDSPQVRLSVLRYYLARMKEGQGKLLFEKNTVNKYARQFDKAAKEADFRSERYSARLSYLRARYADILSSVYSDSIDRALEAVKYYEEFIDYYRGEDSLLLSGEDTRRRYENAWYRRAELSYRQFTDFYKESSIEEEQRENTLEALYDYIRLPVREKAEERMQKVRSYIGELRMR